VVLHQNTLKPLGVNDMMYVKLILQDKNMLIMRMYTKF
jgi:hypothetical protein